MQFGDFDGFDFDSFEDFRVQRRSAKPKGKKPKRSKRTMGQEQSYVTEDTPTLTLSERSLAAVAKYIKSGSARRIVALTGAGISTAAGIPDFRSPETGLYANLASLDLPEPEAVFDLAFFRQNPRPFYALARELYPGVRYRPTVSHAFLALLARRGLLHALFTQNIDCLERAAGVAPDLLVEAHGSFASQRCVECGAPLDDAAMRACVARAEAPPCPTRRGEEGGGGGGGGGGCDGVVKPDIVFFGEALPRRFYERLGVVQEADLMLVMGTSLQVHPFASLPNMAPECVPRVLFNLEEVGTLGSQADDVLVLGDCDSGVRQLADELGWRDELENMWRELVGDEEAERQLRWASRRVPALRDEVTELAEKVEEVLHIGEEEGGQGVEEGNDDMRDGRGVARGESAMGTGGEADEGGIAEEDWVSKPARRAHPAEAHPAQDSTAVSGPGEGSLAVGGERPHGVADSAGKAIV